MGKELASQGIAPMAPHAGSVPMSEDEIGILIVSSILALVTWLVWFLGGTGIRALGRPSARGPLIHAPLLGSLALMLVLKFWASFDVRDSWKYTIFYVVLGAAWVGLARPFIVLLGLNAREDVHERRNAAAAWALAGAILALFACYAGANIGDGPGWWVVVFCALLSTAALFLLWAVFEKILRVSDAVTIDRDLASGVRLAGFLLGAGLILGRAVAGNWISVTATIEDFVRDASPVVILLVVAMALEWMTRPSPSAPRPSVLVNGLIPATITLGGSAIFLALAGPWT